MNRAHFEEGWVLARYLLGHRANDLNGELNCKSPQALELLRSLRRTDRFARAEALSEPLNRLLSAISSGGVR